MKHHKKYQQKLCPSGLSKQVGPMYNPLESKQFLPTVFRRAQSQTGGQLCKPDQHAGLVSHCS